MASISTDPNGNITIQFIGADNRRRSIRPGKLNKKAANELKLKIEALNTLVIAKLPMDADTARWVASIGDDLAAKLAAVGLMPERQSETLGGFLNAYLARRSAGAKPNTVDNIRRVVNDLLAVHPATLGLRHFTSDHADKLHRWYTDKNLKPATIHRQLKFAKQFFADAVKRKLIHENPFALVKIPPGTPSADRQRYIESADVERLIEAAHPALRIVLALARFAGLRCPDEVLLLKWEHVNLAVGRMTVTSPKTECHPGKAYRVVPIFTALRPHLEDAWELAEPGTEFVVSGPTADAHRATEARGWKGANYRTPLAKLMRRSGIDSWPKPFNNMRASCETDLMKHHRIHVVTSWIGHSPRTAMMHYLQTLDADFDKATGQGGAESGAVNLQKPVQSDADTMGQEKPRPSQRQGIMGNSSVAVHSREVLTDTVQEFKYTRQELNL
jgi:integrase